MSGDDGEVSSRKNAQKSIKAENLDDYIMMGRYVILVCIAAELLILPQVSAMFYMMYAGAAPRVISCNGRVFDPILEGKEICFELEKMENCTNPEFYYQFKSVNVEWSYFCKTSKTVKNSIVIQMIGALTGSVVFGQISDSFGRKIGNQIATIGMIISWLTVTQSQTLFQFTVTRTIVAFFAGGSISVVNVFIMENIPKKHRMWINMVITWSPNIPIFAFFAWLAGDWMRLSYLSSLVCIPSLIFFQLFIHESPRWLITKGNLEEARRLLHRQFRISKQEHLIDADFDDILHAEFNKALQQNKKRGQYSYYHLFATPTLSITTISLAFSYCATSIINYGVLFNLEKVSGSMYWNAVYTGLMRYVCNISFGYADLKFSKIGRKFIHTSGLVVVIATLSFVVACYVFHINHEMKEFIRYSILLASSMTSQIYIANGIVGNELFPTPIRTLGYSFLQLWNRVGVVLSPFVFYLADYWLALPFCVMITLSLIDTFSFECLLPETKGKALVEHMPPKEQWFFNKEPKEIELVEEIVEKMP